MILERMSRSNKKLLILLLSGILAISLRLWIYERYENFSILQESFLIED